MVDTTKRLVVQRAHDDFAKVQHCSPDVAGALAGVHRLLLPVATRASQDVALLAGPFQPLTERIAQTAESVALAYAPMLEPLRQGFLASVNQVAPLVADWVTEVNREAFCKHEVKDLKPQGYRVQSTSAFGHLIQSHLGSGYFHLATVVLPLFLNLRSVEGIPWLALRFAAPNRFWVFS
jgi:hypothetical protein